MVSLHSDSECKESGVKGEFCQRFGRIFNDMRCYEGESDKNGESGDNLPRVFREFKSQSL